MSLRGRLFDSGPDDRAVSMQGYAEAFDARIRSGAGLAWDPLPLPWPSLNAALGGGVFGERIYTLGGAFGIGKTSFLLQAAAHIARSGRAAVLAIFYEHSGLEMLHRLVCQESAADRHGGLSLAELHALLVRDAMRRHDGLDRLFREEPATADAFAGVAEYWGALYVKHGHTRKTTLGQIVDDLEDVARQARKPLVLAIDSLQMVPVERSLGPVGKAERIDRLMQELKALASIDGYGCPVLLVSKADRAALKRGRIRAEDLDDGGDNEGGAIAYGSDVVMLANWPTSAGQREARRLTDAGRSERVVWTIDKNRVGPTGSVELDLYGRTFSWQEPAAAAPRRAA